MEDQSTMGPDEPQTSTQTWTTPKRVDAIRRSETSNWMMEMTTGQWRRAQLDDPDDDEAKSYNLKS